MQKNVLGVLVGVCFFSIFTEAASRTQQRVPNQPPPPPPTAAAPSCYSILFRWDKTGEVTYDIDTSLRNQPGWAAAIGRAANGWRIQNTGFILSEQTGSRNVFKAAPQDFQNLSRFFGGRPSMITNVTTL